jgi:hypothetical protein
MATRILFRRIGGRIVPIRSSQSMGPLFDHASAAIKASLKTKIATKTSLAFKRIKILGALRDFVSGRFNRSSTLSNGSKIIGTGAHLQVLSLPKAPNMVVKFGSTRQISKRALIKSQLQKLGLAPETFHVKTSRRSYLIQERLSPAPDTVYSRELDAKAFGFFRKKKALGERIAGKGIEVNDFSPSNVGFDGKGLKTLDSGIYRFSGRKLPFLSTSQRSYAKKFRITMRSAGSLKKVGKP